MALRRFYLELTQSSDVIRVDGELFHHVRDVCRFGVGDQFEILPGDGRALRVSIASVAKREMSVRVEDTRALPRPRGPKLILALSLPKLPKFDWIAEKCVELGVHEIRPFVSDYSFLREVKEISANRVGRWNKLVVAATQQSGRGELMQIQPVVRLGEILNQFGASDKASGVFVFEGESQLGLHPALADIKAADPESIWVFVGSEGGFSAAEVELFRAARLPPVTLGEQILRVETACVALVSIIKYETRGLSHEQFEYGSVR